MMRLPRILSTLGIQRLMLAIVALAAVGAQRVDAQRPIRVFDPFYQDEIARRGFHDRYAVTGELIYRPSGLLSDQSLATAAGEALGVNLRVDYQLAEYLDVGMHLDASNSGIGSAPSLRWLSLKYYRVDEFTDYAVRFAVDPVAQGISGFPQMDLAFLYGSPSSPIVRTDYAMGIRRVQIGIQELMAVVPAPIDPDDPIVTPASDRTVVRTHAFGWEVHMSARYSVVFDPAGSSLYVSLLGEGGSYDLVEWDVATPDLRETSEFNGGVIWASTGLQFDRPTYRFGPYLSVPVSQWAPRDGEWPHRRTRVGFRLTFR
ncbi:MAG: hypothetical protein ACI9W4_000685 [Rhodothermales bacterium]|jgi:hypothetical protein